jgi:hypothetical protein
MARGARSVPLGVAAASTATCQRAPTRSSETRRPSRSSPASRESLGQTDYQPFLGSALAVRVVPTTEVVLDATAALTLDPLIDEPFVDHRDCVAARTLHMPRTADLACASSHGDRDVLVAVVRPLKGQDRATNRARTSPGASPGRVRADAGAGPTTDHGLVLFGGATLPQARSRGAYRAPTRSSLGCRMAA